MCKKQACLEFAFFVCFLQKKHAKTCRKQLKNRQNTGVPGVCLFVACSLQKTIKLKQKTRRTQAKNRQNARNHSQGAAACGRALWALRAKPFSVVFSWGEGGAACHSDFWKRLSKM